MSRPQGLLAARLYVGLLSTLSWLLIAWFTAFAEETVLFAVVTNVAKDRKQVTAQIATAGTVSEATLIPSEDVSENLIWRKLEVCHSLRADASIVPEGHRLLSIKILDAGMLPMALQGVAGDCLLKKALEFAPLVD